MLFEALHEAGHEIKAIHSPIELEDIKDTLKQFTLFLVDNRMPHKGDGERVARMIRDEVPNATIVAFTDDEVQWANLRLGKTTLKLSQMVDFVNNLIH